MQIIMLESAVKGFNKNTWQLKFIVIKQMNIDV